MKSVLSVIWQSNPKSWYTRNFFVESVFETFAPQVKVYLKEKQVPSKCLLVMDTIAHPLDIDDDLPDGFDFTQMKFLPPTTTSILQPMDQHVICYFKKLYTNALFRKCIEVTNGTQLKLIEFWKDHFTIRNCFTLIDNAWTLAIYRTLNSA